MRKEHVDEAIAEWLEWAGLCVKAAQEHCHDSRVFAEPTVIRLLDLKAKDPWDLSMGKDLFELWSGPTSHAKKWDNGEWSLMKGLYLHACGPLPVENYAVNILSDWSEGFGTAVLRGMFARLADHSGHIRGMVDHLASGTAHYLAEGDVISGVDLLRVRESFEALFPGERPELPGFNEEAAGEATQEGTEATQGEEGSLDKPKAQTKGKRRKRASSAVPQDEDDGIEDLL